MSANDCKNRLVVNGPVFAKNLFLNRTWGAFHGSGTVNPVTDVYGTNDGSITPAEIFNLRPDTYLWAYNQAQRFSQAVVTYTRELPPRY
jgi:hypothetical protein